VVPEADAGKRLDVFLADLLGVTRGYVRRLLARERIRLQGRAAVKGAILRAGDRIQLRPFQHPDRGLQAASGIEIPVLREGAGLLAVDKPPGLPTHPLDFEETATVLNALIGRYPQLRGVGEGGLRSGVLHRLDTYTSGVLLFATSDEAWHRVRKAFAERRVDKRYLARVHGAFRGEREVVVRLEHRGRGMRVVASGAREAITRLRAVRTIGESTLLEARPLTGRMHQVRATLAHLGHPVLGDRLYGSSLELDRHLLHATFIEACGFEARSAPPTDFSANV
jgi:23S rRNA pseudouridine1911/1915/1917 synthase